jgi:hypothetical protein
MRPFLVLLVLNIVGVLTGFIIGVNVDGIDGGQFSWNFIPIAGLYR